MEVPIFFYMDTILNTLGTLNTFNMAMLAYSVPLLFHSMLGWLGSPWWVLLSKSLQNIICACVWGAGVEHSKKIAPLGLDATLQVTTEFLDFLFGYVCTRSRT